jgi:hypothetical protein
MTPIRFTLSEMDVLLAGRFGFLCNFKRKFLVLAGLSIAIAAIITGIPYLFLGETVDHAIRDFLILSAIYLAIVLLIGPIIYLFIVPWRARKTMRQMPALGREQTLTWDDKTITLDTDHTHAQLQMSEFHKWAGNNAMLILYPADYVFYVLPRRIFPDVDSFEALQSKFIQAGVKRI